MLNFMNSFFKRSLTSIGLSAIALGTITSANAYESDLISKPFTGQKLKFSFSSAQLELADNSTGSGSFYIKAGGPTLSQGDFDLGTLDGYAIVDGVLQTPSVTSLSTKIGGVGVYAFTFYVSVDPNSSFGLVGEVNVTINGQNVSIPIDSPTFITENQQQNFLYSVSIVVGSGALIDLT